MFKRFLIIIILLIIVFGAIFGFDAFREIMVKKYMANFTQPPSSVTAVKAQYETWQPTIFSIGTLKAYNGVNLSPEQSGVITKIQFKSGETVKAGTPLVMQDTRVYEQDLKNYQAQLVETSADYKRALVLNKKGFMSDQDLDQSRSQYQEAAANVAKTQVIIEQMTIRAPFTGKLGIRNVNLGQYLQPGDTVVNIQQINPLRVIFNLPQQDLANIQVGQKIKLVSEDNPKSKPVYGKITAIDSAVDEDTRNVSIQGEVSNDDLSLLPGMYANVYVLMPQQNKVLTLPQTAISYNPYGDFIYRVEKQTRKIKEKTITGLFANQVFITPGQMRGGQVAIEKGVKEGDLVVTSGQLKLQNGSEVVIKDDKSFKADTHPNPKELH